MTPKKSKEVKIVSYSISKGGGKRVRIRLSCGHVIKGKKLLTTLSKIMHTRCAIWLLVMAAMFGHGGGAVSVPSGTAVVTPGGSIFYNPVPLRDGYYTTPGTVSGQTICQKERPKADLAAYHSGDKYGPKYAGMYCIGPLE